jgi:vitellogenic carboxypeptidase-like protein
LLWLQGGPGASSLFGLFVENGPYIVNEDLNITFNKHSWTQEFSMIYVDNPVGTGFSFTDDNEGYSRNEESVADNLYEALQQFFTIFSEYRDNEFYITGESYAGKYIPAIGNKLHLLSNESNINFKGIAIGNGWIDSIDMLDMGSFLYQIGLIDEKQTQHFYEEQNMTAFYVANGEYLNATKTYDQLIGNLKSNYSV